MVDISKSPDGPHTPGSQVTIKLKGAPGIPASKGYKLSLTIRGALEVGDQTVPFTSQPIEVVVPPTPPKPPEILRVNTVVWDGKGPARVVSMTGQNSNEVEIKLVVPED